MVANMCSHLRKPQSSQRQLLYYRSPKYTLRSFSTHFNIFKTIKHEFCCEISELQMLTIKRTFSHSQQIMKNGNNEHDGILLLQRFY